MKNKMMLVGLLFSLQICGLAKEEDVKKDAQYYINLIINGIAPHLQKELGQKDEIITDLQRQVSTLTEENTGLKTQVSTTERANCILSAILAKRDEQIKGLSATLAERDGQIKGLSEKVRELTTLNSQLTKDSQNRSVARFIYWK